MTNKLSATDTNYVKFSLIRFYDYVIIINVIYYLYYLLKISLTYRINIPL